MSTIPVPEFDFWEFVSCAHCQLPFAGSAVPFWLTECGHVLCNAHLNSDQSCAQCGTAGIQLVPLQQEMEAPMSDWFRPVPHALDSVAYAAKFQQETMALQIRYYKLRHNQQRAMIDRFKRDVLELKKVNGILAHENAQFREQMGLGYQQDGGPEPFENLNSNGKRAMNDPDQYRPRTSSSRSRSAVTPLGPNRLTLPPGQHPPSLSSNRPQEEVSYTQSSNKSAPKVQRPGSSRFLEQYSYIPASPQQFYPQPLSHTQAAPRRTKQSQEQKPPQAQPQVVPVSNSARFKPAQEGSHNKAHGHTAIPNRNQHPGTKPRNMGPPPTPQQARPQAAIPPPSVRRGHGSASLPTNSSRFLPPNQRFATPAPINPPYFMPSNNAPPGQRFSDGSNNLSRGPLVSAASSRAPSRAAGPAVVNISGSGQRMPFVPHAPGGFG